MPRTDIHPKYYTAKITCITCHNEFECGTTKGTEIRIDTCSSCHPFYTGSQKFSIATGQVEKYRARLAKAEEIKQKTALASAKQKEINKEKATQTKKEEANSEEK